MGIFEVVGLEPLGLVAADSWLLGSGILLVEDGIFPARRRFLHAKPLFQRL